MVEGVVKRDGKEIAIDPIPDGLWKGSFLAEVFPTTGSTRMSAGIHRIPPSRTTVHNPPVDDVLYILEGEMDILSEGAVIHFEKGDFAYLRAGVPRTFIVHKQVTHVYVTYPAQWK